MLLEYIERMRNESRGARLHLTWVWSISLTGTIVLVWLSVIFGRWYIERDTPIAPHDDGGERVVESPRTTQERFDYANQFITGQSDADDVSNGSQESGKQVVETKNQVPGTILEDAALSATSVSATSSLDHVTTSTPQLWP